MGMVVEGRDAQALRRLDHRLRNELFGLQLRGDAAALKRSARLKTRLAAIGDILAMTYKRREPVVDSEPPDAA
jgi:hypothetical protein